MKVKVQKYNIYIIYEFLNVIVIQLYIDKCVRYYILMFKFKKVKFKRE